MRIFLSLKVNLFVGVVAVVLLALLLAPAVAQAAAWSIVASPTTGMVEGNLLGVAAVATNDVWAVGSFLPTKGGGQALIEHWNGHKWSVVKNPSTVGTELHAVAAVATNDDWAVGSFRNAGGAFQTLTLHWDGTAWSIVPSPSPDGAFNDLFSVAAFSTSDVWAEEVGRA